MGMLGPSSGAVLVPYPTVVDCFEAVRSGAVPEAFVPIENSIEGSVNQTLDQLVAAGGEVVIRAEAVHPVRHHLIARTPLGPPSVPPAKNDATRITPPIAITTAGITFLK